MTGLVELVKSEVEWFAGMGVGANLLLHRVLDDSRQHYAVIAIRHPRGKRLSDDDDGYDGTGIVVMARVKEDQVIIEVDNTDRPLYKSLLLAGVPREQIILAYAGEPVPEPVEVYSTAVKTE